MAVVGLALERRTGQMLGLAGASLCTVYVLEQLPGMTREQDYTGLVPIWLLGFVFYVFAAAPPRSTPVPDWRAWWQDHGKNALALCFLVLLAFVLRVLQIGTIPFVLDGDEASFGIEALRVISGELRNPFGTGELSQPTMSFFYSSLGLRFFGSNATGVRIPWMLLGTATIPVSFWLVSRLKGPFLGWLTAALLATFHFHIHYSRLGLNNIADPLLGGLALLFFYRAVARRSTLDWVWTGAVAAVAMYAYTGARLVPVLVVTMAGYHLVVGGSSFWREHRHGMLTALGAFLIIAAPMLQFAIRFTDDFNGRLNATGIFARGWLEQESIKLGASVPEILLDQFRRAALAFSFYPDTGNHYGLSQPLLDPVFGLLFLLGLGYGTARVLTPGRGHALFPMVAWWWAGTILGGMLTVGPPISGRLVTLTLPVCFFIALAVAQLLRLAERALVGVPSRAIASAAVLVFAVISLHLYFIVYSPLHSAGGLVAEAATELAPNLTEWSPARRIHFFGAPLVFWDFPTFRFFAPDADVVDHVDPLTAPPPADWMPRGRGAVFIFMPGRTGEIDFIRKAFPDGELNEYRSPRDKRVIVTAYRVPR